MEVTATIPIVFGVGDDPVKWGIVADLGRPNSNATGINFFVSEVVAKRLGLLRELIPGVARIAVLLNSSDPARDDWKTLYFTNWNYLGAVKLKIAGIPVPVPKKT